MPGNGRCGDLSDLTGDSRAATSEALIVDWLSFGDGEMVRKSWRLGALSCVLACSGYTASGNAGTVAPEQEYAKYIDKNRIIQGIGNTPFGEQINLRDGNIQFRQIDIELPGTGPTIRIARTFKVNEIVKVPESTGNHFGGWELEIPRLKTIAAMPYGAIGESPYGWQVPGINRNARCTNFSAPGEISFSDWARHWSTSEWWAGYQLVDDYGEEQQVLQRLSSSPMQSAANNYIALTLGKWGISCLSATANGEPGEAFLAVAPDGTKYWLNYLIYGTGDTLGKPLWSGSPLGIAGTNAQRENSSGAVKPMVVDDDYLDRSYAAMLVTRIEDRFGNWVTYNYTSGLLNSIEASDGRHVDFARDNANGLIAAIGVGQGSNRRIWTYQRDGNYSLASVVLPDGSKWAYGFSTLKAAPSLSPGPRACFDLLPNNPYRSALQGTATAPSGITETIIFQRRPFGRSYVYRECWGGERIDDGFATIPADWMAYALQSRTLSGVGIPNLTWTYDYSPSNAGWLQDCTSSCPSTIWTDVTAPDGTRTRSIFSNKFDETENLLLREEIHASGSGALVKSIDYSYATFPINGGNPYPWPEYVGDDLQTRTNAARSERWAPIRHTVITQDGRTFSRVVNNFDVYARPTKVTKTSASSP